MEISKSVDILSSHKKYAEGFTLEKFLLFEICAFLKSDVFVCWHTETIEYVNK